MNVLKGERFEQRRILYQGRAEWTTVDGEELVLMDGRRVVEAEATYLPPCDPTKIICIHLNYESRRIEFRAPTLVTPTFFQKPVTAVNSHRGMLNRPDNCQYLNYEGEVAAIIGRPMKNVPPEEAWNYIAGFAPANDVGAHDFRDTDGGGMTRVKGMDGFCPLGPGIVRGIDVRASTLRTYINGAAVQEGDVSEMTFGIDYQLADLSRHITLLPGDIILTGTPANSRPMQPGDVVEVEVTGLGRLTNTVQDVPAPAHDIGHDPTDTVAVRRVALGGDWWAEQEAD
ncbi:MAG: fumarylacetoacetate hydrolase family protein [Gammaproteobacteria bacterium]|nr:fumarylacetoacetate hydrolase family protein [Gammaproteobacteria bacterium]MDE0365103.1 fumarylacetoacetate hydrolase family protein [Gammaproteobacteria bacterium]